ncbi:MAG: retropepsin-like aspartic protease [Planctomycetota bacterium]
MADFVYRLVCRQVLLAAFCAVFLATPRVAAVETDVPFGGFLPFAGITLTDEFKSGDVFGAADFFFTDTETSLVGSKLTGASGEYFDLALVDTGAVTHILNAEASGSAGFDIDGNGFDGLGVQQIGGATGVINLGVNNPHGFFAAGLADRTGAGAALDFPDSAFRGQSSFATLSAPPAFELPSILGLPMAAQHQLVIRNDQPQIFEYQGRTVRSPQVEFTDLGSTTHGIVRRSALKLRPGIGFVQGPIYVQSLDLLGFEPLHENPTTPSLIENGGLLIDVDMTRDGDAIDDKEFLFDTGADFTVVSQQTAVRLGFDPVLDTPDFIVQVEGSGGIQDGIPGFVVDTLRLDTVGGSFELTNVPVAVLDVTNPTDPGNIVDGILGMHAFVGRNIAIDTTPSIGQGGVGPSLYIGDKVTDERRWNAAGAGGDWAATSSWASPGTPGELWDVTVAPRSGQSQIAEVSADSTVFRLTLEGNGQAGMTVDVENRATLTVFADVEINAGGTLHLGGGGLDAQFVQIEGGSLTGDGELMLGSGPLSGSVRNEAGVVAPGDPLGDVFGRLDVLGDYSQGELGTLEIELGGTIAGTQFDQVDAERFVFLSGALEVELAGGYTPGIGDAFRIVQAGDESFGEFDSVRLPGGLVWGLAYDATGVLLSVISTLPGDFDGDLDVDDDDLTAWQAGVGTPGFDSAGLLDWQRNFGTDLSPVSAVPEPSAVLALLSFTVWWAALRRW